MEQYIDEYLRNIFGEVLEEEEELKPSVKFKQIPQIYKAFRSIGSSRIGSGKETWKRLSPGGKVAAGAIAGTALGAGILAARKYRSAAEKACSQFTGERKSECIAKYKAGGYHAEMLALKENSIICNESQDRDSCFRLVAMRIMELQKLISN